MPRLTGAARRWGNDRGAVSAIFGVLLAGGVLLGMTAIVVDVGGLYAEREELLSGADAAAMEVALNCAQNRSNCTTAGVDTTAVAYAEANARDARANVDTVCGNDGLGRLAACSASAFHNLTDCVRPRPVDGTSYVEVRTSTETRDGQTLLPPVVAQAVMPGYAGSTVVACARVGWGAPSGGVALTVSACEFELAVSGARVVTGTPAAEDEVVLYTHSHADANECDSAPGRSALPGGFGWVTHNSSCRMSTASSETYSSDPGAATPNDCRDELSSLLASRRPTAIPIFNGVTGAGAGGTYTLQGYAGFVITGWRLPGARPTEERSWLTNSSVCRGSDQCVYGYFTNAVVQWDGAFGGAPSLGAVVVKTIG